MICGVTAGLPPNTQFVGSVPGVPGAAPAIVLLRIPFVLVSSNSNPRGSQRGALIAAVCIVPVLSKYVPVLARVNVMRGSSVPGDMKDRSSEAPGGRLAVFRTPPRHASTANRSVTHWPYAETGIAAPASNNARRPTTTTDAPRTPAPWSRR